jgi:peptide deformylase
MIDTMRTEGGVGLAAPQIGIPLRLAVIQMPGDNSEPIVLINPEVVKRSGEREVIEGCLSVPGYHGEIIRSESITIKALNTQGKRFRIKATGLMAQTLEHELDHLNGVLYIDHIQDEDKFHINEPEPIKGEVDNLLRTDIKEQSIEKNQDLF